MPEEVFISLKEVMEYMNSGMPFSFTCIKANKQTGRGGGVMVVNQAVKHGLQAESFGDKIKDERAMIKGIRNPRHFDNSTFNVRVTAAGSADIRTIHPRLIRRFNGKTVL